MLVACFGIDPFLAACGCVWSCGYIGNLVFLSALINTDNFQS
jgi:hypothetical protein